MSSIARREPEVFESPDMIEAIKEEEKKGPDAKNAEEAKKSTSEDVIRSDIRPQLAFEQFAHKVFDTSNLNFSDSVLKQISTQQTEISSMRAKERVFESPLERYNRIRREIQEFQQDLTTLSEQSQKDSSGAVVASALVRELSSLEKEVQATASNAAFKPFLSQDVTDKDYVEQKNLLDKLVSQMEAAAAAPEAKNADGSRITYELFFNPAKEASRQQVNVVELDRRIGHLEKAIGVTDDKTLGFADLNTAVLSLRRKLDFLDPTRLEAIYRRVKTVTTELEAFQASKDKAVAQGQLPATLEKINALYDAVARWDEASHLLPSVIGRLQSLRDLHEECASAVLRLQQVDGEHSQLMSLLNQDKESLQKVEKNLAQNMKVMQGNVLTLENRFKALSAKMDLLK